jgi:hypothetical protein
MPTRITLRVGALVVLLGVLGLTQPAAAAPPQPYHYGDCLAYELDGAHHEYCYEFQGTEILQTSPSGVTTYIDKGTLSETLTINGALVESQVEKYTYMGVAKDHEPILTRELGGGSISYVDPLTGDVVTCTYDYSFLDTKLQLRHAAANADCS